MFSVVALRWVTGMLLEYSAAISCIRISPLAGGGVKTVSANPKVRLFVDLGRLR